MGKSIQHWNQYQIVWFDFCWAPPRNTATKHASKYGKRQQAQCFFFVFSAVSVFRSLWRVLLWPSSWSGSTESQHRGSLRGWRGLRRLQTQHRRHQLSTLCAGLLQVCTFGNFKGAGDTRGKLYVNGSLPHWFFMLISMVALWGQSDVEKGIK